MMKPIAIKKFVLVLTLIITGLACSRAGELITAEEATRRAVPTATTELLSIEGAAFAVNDEAVIVGGSSGALVPLYGRAGDRFFSSQVLAGTEVVVSAIDRQPDGVFWYEVEGMMGDGWLREGNLAPRAEEGS
jgi:hypothetical protein